MRTFSRWMPPISKPAPSTRERLTGYAALGLLAVALIVLLLKSPEARVIVAAILVLMAGSIPIEGHRLRRLAANRPDDSICTFARFFDRASTDPRVIRAVYDRLIDDFTVDGKPLPIRPTDTFRRDLRIAGEDIYDVIIDAAQRSGRSMDNPKGNPFYRHIGSVEGIVRFLNAQPPVSTPIRAASNEAGEAGAGCEQT